eukprot:TRINITY_DN64981_c0_g1_i2.p1 TRINITY_DN64981_c0_g1~~TRINITY_DN64981_c0_g1_i2.p1  ORF type:complete len:372 (+),score=51.90 TRINITY_DN64981_c0_g1_i2:112-1116(+)
MQENLNHIQMFECRENPKPQDPQMLPEPYGAGLYPKLVSTLTSSDLVLRRKAVSAMLHYFAQKQDHVTSVIDKNGITALLQTLCDDDVEVRINSCIALRYIVEQPKGQQRILEQNLQAKLKDAVYDTQPEVVVEALRVLAAMDAHWNDRAGTKALISVKCIPLYIQQARDGTTPVKTEALKALNKVYNVKEAFNEVLENDAMEMLASLLYKQEAQVVQQAAENIAELCFYSAGKRAAVKNAATTERITIDNNGKEQCLGCNGVETLMDCIENESNSNVLANCMKAICNLSEHPIARTRLHGAVHRLREIEGEKGVDQRLVTSAKRAIELITWQP